MSQICFFHILFRFILHNRNFTHLESRANTPIFETSLTKSNVGENTMSFVRLLGNEMSQSVPTRDVFLTQFETYIGESEQNFLIALGPVVTNQLSFSLTQMIF